MVNDEVMQQNMDGGAEELQAGRLPAEQLKAEQLKAERLKAVNETKKWNMRHIILTCVSLLPILLWPFIFYRPVLMALLLSAVGGQKTLVWVILAYPLILIANAALSRWLFKQSKLSSFLFPFWPIVLFAALLIIAALV